MQRPVTSSHQTVPLSFLPTTTTDGDETVDVRAALPADLVLRARIAAVAVVLLIIDLWLIVARS